LLTFILKQAKRRHSKVYLHAQLSVVDFYLQAGFIRRGDVFLDANIPHILMEKHW